LRYLVFSVHSCSVMETTTPKRMVKGTWNRHEGQFVVKVKNGGDG